MENTCYYCIESFETDDPDVHYCKPCIAYIEEREDKAEIYHGLDKIHSE